MQLTVFNMCFIIASYYLECLGHFPAAIHLHDFPDAGVHLDHLGQELGLGPHLRASVWAPVVRGPDLCLLVVDGLGQEVAELNALLPGIHEQVELFLVFGVDVKIRGKVVTVKVPVIVSVLRIILGGIQKK